ncbi:MAG: hypothetical protein IJ814_03960 [Paludibacteraceae bacterium]|nr:hypothetical protein [Paludibacteraceae bacterium]
MARAELSPGLERLSGKLAGRSSVQMRYKQWKDDNGNVVKTGPQEYFKRRSRDYKRSPRTEAEKVQAELWRAVCREASEIIKDKNHPRYAELRARWNNQFHAGADEYLNEGKNKNVVYGMFPVFVRMVILKEKKTAKMS